MLVASFCFVFVGLESLLRFGGMREGWDRRRVRRGGFVISTGLVFYREARTSFLFLVVKSWAKGCRYRYRYGGCRGGGGPLIVWLACGVCVSLGAVLDRCLYLRVIYVEQGQ